MHRREHVCCALHNALSRFWHCNGRAGGQEDRLIARAQRQKAEVVALDEHNFLVAKSHLSTRVTRHVHAAKNCARFVCGNCGRLQRVQR